jgi:hypothetical protein
MEFIAIAATEWLRAEIENPGFNVPVNPGILPHF